MLIVIARFPEVPAEKEEAFEEWFAWSNEQLSDTPGLLGRRLLRSADGAYAALVEHESAGSLEAMHSAPVVAEVHARLGAIVAQPPSATRYELVSGSRSRPAPS